MNLPRSITDLQLWQCRPLLVSSKFAIWCTRGSLNIRYYKILKEIFHSFFLSITHMVGSGNVIPPELCLCQERGQKDRLVYHYLFNSVVTEKHLPRPADKEFICCSRLFEVIIL